MAFSRQGKGEEGVPSLLNHFRGHKGPVLSLTFHPNLPTLFSGGCDGHIMTWNFRKESRALRFEGHCGPVNALSLTSDGTLLGSASDDGTVRIWVPTINGHFLSIKGHAGAVKGVDFNPADSTRFATCSHDKTVKVWSVLAGKNKRGDTRFKTHEFLDSFRGHKNWVRSVRYSPDGSLLCSASDDRTVQVFDPRSKCQVVACFNCPVGLPLTAAFNPCGPQYLGVSSSEKAFLLYDVRAKKLVQSYMDIFPKGAVTSFAFHNSGDFAVCVGEEPKIKILDLVEGRPIFTLLGPRKGVLATAFNENGSLFATGGRDEEVLIWEPNLTPYQEPGAEEVGDGQFQGQEQKENTGANATSASSSSSSLAGKGKIQEPEIVASNSRNAEEVEEDEFFGAGSSAFQNAAKLSTTLFSGSKK